MTRVEETIIDPTLPPESPDLRPFEVYGQELGEVDVNDVDADGAMSAGDVPLA